MSVLFRGPSTVVPDHVRALQRKLDQNAAATQDLQLAVATRGCDALRSLNALNDKNCTGDLTGRLFLAKRQNGVLIPVAPVTSRSLQTTRVDVTTSNLGPPPLVPPVLTAVWDTDHIEVTWTDALPGATYVLQRNAVGAFFTGTGTSLDDDDVVSGTEYCYTVRYTSGSRTATSNTACVTPPGCILPGDFTLTATQSGYDVSLSWTASTGVDNYALWKDGAHLWSGTDTSYVDEGLGIDTYCYVVYAVNGCGNTLSNEICIMVVPQYPSEQGPGPGTLATMRYKDSLGNIYNADGTFRSHASLSADQVYAQGFGDTGSPSHYGHATYAENEADFLAAGLVSNLGQVEDILSKFSSGYPAGANVQTDAGWGNAFAHESYATGAAAAGFASSDCGFVGMLKRRYGQCASAGCPEGDRVIVSGGAIAWATDQPIAVVDLPGSSPATNTTIGISGGSLGAQIVVYIRSREYATTSLGALPKVIFGSGFVTMDDLRIYRTGAGFEGGDRRPLYWAATLELTAGGFDFAPGYPQEWEFLGNRGCDVGMSTSTTSGFNVTVCVEHAATILDSPVSNGLTTWAWQFFGPDRLTIRKQSDASFLHHDGLPSGVPGQFYTTMPPGVAGTQSMNRLALGAADADSQFLIFNNGIDYPKDQDRPAWIVYWDGSSLSVRSQITFECSAAPDGPIDYGPRLFWQEEDV